MLRPSREEFRELAATHTVVPVWRELLADLITPVAAFALLAGRTDTSVFVDQGLFFSGAAVLGVGTALVYFMTDFAGDARTEGTVTVTRRSFVVEPGVAWGRDGDAELGLFLTRGF